MAVNLSFSLVKFLLRILADNKRREFIEACKHPEIYQNKIKEKILSNSLIPFPDSPAEYKFYQGKVLTQDKILFYEPTSGSTGAKKEIPYTRLMLKTFQNMFLLWAHDLLFHSGMNFTSGKFFMSISPRIGEESGDDRKYLSPLMNLLLSPFLASHPDSHHSKSGEEFLAKISADLKQCRDLEIISIWSPTYFLSLLNHMGEVNVKELWPHLKVISCWADAQAEKSSTLLSEKFPDVLIQSKGLLMTEGAVTIPWAEAQGHIPLVTETLIELFDGEKIISLHEARIGEEYTVLISQHNGYLRYNTMDRIRVTHYYYKTPVFKFLGREGQTSDLAGEKFSEVLLRNTFSDVNDVFLVVPDQSQNIPGYVIIQNESSQINWEQKLRSIYHYNLAREIGQLLPLRVISVKNVQDVYSRFCQDNGMRLGDIKERVLINDLKLAQKFLAWIDRESQSSLPA